ncbi:hypothetical protein [Paenibacillus sp. GCM10027626]|uniref:hypothetical protein n=1 Tax=Paenibacillus sp. GCM10027626 TaxID=3273411 RepID=UPI0036258619
MQFKVLQGYVKHEGALIPKGSFFDAELHEVKGLLSKGFVTKVEPLSELPDEVEVELPSVEEFAKLKADEQKELLQELGIEPASNAEERIQQYTEFYDQADDNEV